MTLIKISGVVAMLLAGVTWTAGATAFQKVTQESAPAVAGLSHAERLEEARNMQCISGLEHMLPGIYYYCVGARDLARGKSARGIDMLKIAAGWGSKPAQLTLGIGYYNGAVVTVNRPLGLAWLGLAAERHASYMTAIFKSAWDKATPQERQQAQSLWRKLLPKYGDRRAAHRAERRYTQARTDLVRNAVYGATVCIAGLTTAQVASPDPDDPASCMGAMPVGMVAKITDNYADILLRGWRGHVSVGPVQQVKPAPDK